MRALIVTIMNLNNYGNRLQSFAVHELLRSFGISGTSMVLCADRTVVQRIKDTARRIVSRRLRKRGIRYERFRRFTDSYAPFKFIEAKQLSKYVNASDLVVFGSDQVWSPLFLKDESDPTAFFMPNVALNKKIALSPSIGQPNIPDYMEPMYAAGLQSFARLSVREDAGAQIIKQVSGMDAEVLADPTIAVKADIWRTIANYEFCPDAPYLLIYQLGDKTDEVMTKVLEYAKEHSLDIVDLMDKESGYYDIGPAEFIGLIDNASYVLTDSFHGSIFSILLHTPFCMLRRVGEGWQNMFSRMETLADKFGCWDRIIDDSDETLPTANIDWESIDSNIAFERGKILDYMAEELVRCGLV